MNNKKEKEDLHNVMQTPSDKNSASDRENAADKNMSGFEEFMNLNLSKEACL